MNKAAAKKLCLFLSVVLAFALIIPVFCPVISHAETDFSTVRVYISRIGSSLTSKSFTVNGSYSIKGSGISLVAGRKYTVSVSGSALSLTDSVTGEVYSLGTAAMLEASGSDPALNNIAISSSGGSTTYYYPDDMYIQYQSSSSTLRFINYALMEHYIAGVVSREMSESWPLEALKAQAVAARTYVADKMLGGEPNYDVDDTTSYQAYCGYYTANTSIKQAAEETAGMILTYSGEPISAMYAASNGGQTVSGYMYSGSESYPYLTMKDDPYDLENPSSVQRTFSFPKTVTSSAAIDSVALSVLDPLVEAKVGTGYTINSVSGVTPHSYSNSRYPSGCIRYSKIDVALNVTDSSGAKQNITVTMAFSSLRSAYLAANDGASMQSNSTLTVEETDSAYVLYVRAYGHGVGMSQRGAQQMARNYNMSYTDILNFYYVGCTFSSIGGYEQVYVQLTDGELALRSGPGTQYPRLATIPADATISLLEEGETWSYVMYGDKAGYVYSAFINPAQIDTSVSGDTVIATGRVSLSSSSSTLNVRSSPSTSASVLGSLKHGTTVQIYAKLDGWYKIKYNDTFGYISSDYVTLT